MPAETSVLASRVMVSDRSARSAPKVAWAEESSLEHKQPVKRRMAGARVVAFQQPSQHLARSLVKRSETGRRVRRGRQSATMHAPSLVKPPGDEQHQRNRLGAIRMASSIFSTHRVSSSRGAASGAQRARGCRSCTRSGVPPLHPLDSGPRHAIFLCQNAQRSAL